MSILAPQLICKPDSSPTETKELTATENLHLNEARISAVCFQEACALFQHKQQHYLTGFGSSGANISMLSQIMKITFYRVLNLVNTCYSSLRENTKHFKYNIFSRLSSADMQVQFIIQGSVYMPLNLVTVQNGNKGFLKHVHFLRKM